MTRINPNADKGRGKTARSLRGVSKGTHEFFPKDRTKAKIDPKAKYKKRRKK